MSLVGGLLRPHDETFTSSIWVTAFSIELVLYAIGTVFVIFMLVSDRAVTVHKTAASVDPLSGMLNRRGFSEASNRVIEREAAQELPLSLENWRRKTAGRAASQRQVPAT